MSALGSATFVSPEQYLERERAAETKSEYFQGEIFAMAGGTETHSLLSTNAIFVFRSRLTYPDCRVYNSDLRINVSENGLYTYADAFVICGQPRFVDGRRDTVTNPKLIVEVLSSSTRDYDRGRKFHLYRELPSLDEYLTIEQEKVHVEHWVRQGPDQWLFTQCTDSGGSLSLPSLSIDIPVASLYEGVVFESASNIGQ